MRIKIKNLGVLKQAEFSLGDMTIICGGNNTGKTYATYALFGFLSVWDQSFDIEIKEQQINQLLDEGVVYIPILEYFQNMENILAKWCEEYTTLLSKVFAVSAEHFKNTDFQVFLEKKENKLNQTYQQDIGSVNTNLFSIIKDKDSTDLIVTLLLDKEQIKITRLSIKSIINDALKEIIFCQFFPKPFIASAERTGAAIFRKELNFARNRLLEEISQLDQEINPSKLLFKGYDDYALPVKSNVEFTRQIETIAKKKSFIAEQHPDLLDQFADIIGGNYTVTQNDQLCYIPKGKKINLSMNESSSGVRSLLDIGFYLNHVAQPGDLLMVDEPELNLHPENQRRVARLFAKLVNLGIKVFMTTHSDYIIKELNTLIMLNQDKPYLKTIAEREGYQQDELLSADKIKVYIAEEALIKLDGEQDLTRCQTLTEANIDPELGIEVTSFDTTIDTMNRIQEDIVWGVG